MNLFIKKLLCVLPVLLLFLFTSQLSADEQGHGTSHKTSENIGHKPTSPAMMHMSHSNMINSEKDFLREMIPHHQEAVDTSVLLFVSTDDPELKMLTKSVYKAQTAEILDMRLSYARWYNLIPTGFMSQSMMRDLNIVPGRERDIRYVQDMIMHHKGALEMAEKVLTFKDIHEETVIFAKDIIRNQKTEIDFMQKWLNKAGASQ
ncbi:MAG: DUF305 domain-containing protein [Nitrospirota bacterium]